MRELHALLRQSLAGLRLLVVATAVLGLAYPAVVRGFAAVAAPWQARGSLLTASGAHTTDPDRAVGSALLGQPTTDARLFFSRPSASGYDPRASGGSNLGPDNPVLVRQIERRRADVARREGVAPDAVPPDAVTASGSGLDPDISVAYADLQVPRVARMTGLPVAAVRALVSAHTSGRTVGVLGEPRVAVLPLDLAVLRAASGS